jgi:hypothetical protein
MFNCVAIQWRPGRWPSPPVPDQWIASPPLAAAVPVSIGRSVTFIAVQRARTVRSMSGRSPRAGDVLECALECLLECLLEILLVVQSPYLLRHRNKAVMALAIRDFLPG